MERPSRHDHLSKLAMEFMSKPLDTILPLPGVVDFDQGTAIVLWRYGRFQVELITLRPGAGFPLEHRHPDVDTIDIPFGSEVPLTMDGKPCKAQPRRRSAGACTKVPLLLNRITENDWHGATKVKKGSAFFSVQEWKNGVEPTSVVLNWQGPVLGANHLKMLGAKRV
jgi:hypothetical protein